MAKKYLNFKFSEFTTNKNFKNNKKKILKVLPEKHLLDAHKVISKWKGYKKTPLINLRILSKKLCTVCLVSTLIICNIVIGVIPVAVNWVF